MYSSVLPARAALPGCRVTPTSQPPAAHLSASRSSGSWCCRAGFPPTAPPAGRRSNAAQITAQYVSTIMAAAAEPAGGGGAALAPPANAEVVIDNWFNPNLDYRWFMLPNLVGMLSLGVALMITALSVARERELGTFDQTLVSPATPVEIALGKLLPPLLVAISTGV